jgi:hypothetical protein
MNSSEDDIYDYDRSPFFCLLQSPRFYRRFEFIQEHQGIVVCPLNKIKVNTSDLSKQSQKENDLVDRHLFVPSPFYKNQFIPLSSLICLASISSSSSSAKNSTNFLSLDHFQSITLSIISSDKSENNYEMVLMYKKRRICQTIRLLNIQTAYTENSGKSYRILIVNDKLKYKKPSSSSTRNKSVESFTLNTTSDTLNKNFIETDSDDEQKIINNRLSAIDENDTVFNKSDNSTNQFDSFKKQR